MWEQLVILSVIIRISTASLVGVDPNTLSCDPNGQVYLNLPHYKDCTKFYTCVHGKEVEQRCAPGTRFDFELQVCNWPYATKCWLRTKNTTTTTTTTPEPTTTTTTPEPTTTTTTPEPTTTTTTPEPTTTTTTPEPTTTKTTPEPTTTTTESSTTSGPNTTETPGTTEIVDPNSVSCDVLMEDGATQLLPHHSNCSRYYACSNGAEIEMSCAPGTVFDYPLQVCNWPSATKCWLRGNVTTTTTEDYATTTDGPEGSGDLWDDDAGLSSSNEPNAKGDDVKALEEEEFILHTR